MTASLFAGTVNPVSAVYENVDEFDKLGELDPLGLSCCRLVPGLVDSEAGLAEEAKQFGSAVVGLSG